MNENELFARLLRIINSKISLQESHLESIRDQMETSEDMAELNSLYLQRLELTTVLSDLKEIKQAYSSLLDQLDILHEYEAKCNELSTREARYFNEEVKS